MQLEVEAAGVADGLALRVAAPQRRGGGLAVGAQHAGPLRAHLHAHAHVTRTRRHTTCKCIIPRHGFRYC